MWRFDHRIMDVAARQHVGEFVADQFADAQLALRAAGGLIAMLLMACHFLMTVMPGLGPRISFIPICRALQHRDCRIKPGDDSRSRRT